MGAVGDVPSNGGQVAVGVRPGCPARILHATQTCGLCWARYFHRAHRKSINYLQHARAASNTRNKRIEKQAFSETCTLHEPPNYGVALATFQANVECQAVALRPSPTRKGPCSPAEPAPQWPGCARLWATLAHDVKSARQSASAGQRHTKQTAPGRLRGLRNREYRRRACTREAHACLRRGQAGEVA